MKSFNVSSDSAAGKTPLACTTTAAVSEATDHQHRSCAHNKKTVAVLLEEQSGPSPGRATRTLADSGWQVLPHAEALRLAMLKTG